MGAINSEVEHPFNFDKGSVGLARSQSYNTEDSQFFIILKAEPLYETEYTPIGKVIYGLEALKKIKYSDIFHLLNRVITTSRKWVTFN